MYIYIIYNIILNIHKSVYIYIRKSYVHIWRDTIIYSIISQDMLNEVKFKVLLGGVTLIVKNDQIRPYCHSTWSHTVKPIFKGQLNIPEKVSLHDGCPFVTGSLTWEREDRTPFWESVPWSLGVLSSQCPLKTGFTVYTKMTILLNVVTIYQICQASNNVKGILDKPVHPVYSKKYYKHQPSMGYLLH